MIPTQWSIASIRRVLTLYLVLVLYSAVYVYFYAAQLTAMYTDDYTAFDFSKLDIYRQLCFLTPLAILPMGTHLRAPSQLIVAAMAVLVFIPIPIVFVAMVPAAEFWQAYALLWLTFFIVCWLAPLSVPIRAPQMSEQGFAWLLVILYLLAAVGFLYCYRTNHFRITVLSMAHAAQADMTIKGWQGYLLLGFSGSFGGLLIAMAVMYRKYYLLLPVLAGYYVCYGLLNERAPAMMPLWIAYLYFAQRWFFRDSVIRYVLTIMAPFAIGVSLVFVLGFEGQTTTFYQLFGLANYRLYSIPAISFNIYYNFFADHPFTYWSHIGFISNFVSYPYGQPLGAVLNEQYAMGNTNASFIESDGLAAAGPLAMPLAGLVFGLVMVGINSCLRGLNRTLCTIVMAAASVTLQDVPLGVGLVTYGLALMSVILLIAPREARWNLRYLNPSPRPAAA